MVVLVGRGCILSFQDSNLHELSLLLEMLLDSCLRHMHRSNHRGLRVAHRPLLQISILLHSILIKICKYLTIVLVGQNRPFVDNAFSFEDIPFISVEPINACLHCFLDYELLNYEITFAPLL